MSGTLPSGVDFTSAGVFYGTPTAAGGPYSSVIKVTDSHGASATSTFTFNVAAYPAITTTSPLTNGEVNLFYSRTLTASGGVGPFSWSKQSGTWPDGLTLSSTGVLSGTPTAVGSSTNIKVRVTDSYSISANVTLAITIVSAPTITTTTLPSSAVSAVYNQTLQRTGGVSPFSWQVLSGTLPTGLTLSTDGVISGTPTAAGTSPFTVKLTDSMGGIATQNLSITIAAAPQITTPLTLPNGEVSAAYSQSLQVSGGLSPFKLGGYSGDIADRAEFDLSWSYHGHTYYSRRAHLCDN